MPVTKINSHANMLSMIIDDHGGRFADELEKKAISRARRIRTKRVKAMKKEAPVKTGRYRDGISGEVAVTGSQIDVTIGGSDRKTHWIEYGTRKMSPRPVITKNFKGIEEEFTAGIVEDAEKIKDMC
jgi:HK97 gp10 family phage protein